MRIIVEKNNIQWYEDFEFSFLLALRIQNKDFF